VFESLHTAWLLCRGSLAFSFLGGVKELLGEQICDDTWTELACIYIT